MGLDPGHTAPCEPCEATCCGQSGPADQLQTTVFEVLQLVHRTLQWEVRALVLSYPRNTEARRSAVDKWYPVYCYRRSAARRLDLFISL